MRKQKRVMRWGRVFMLGVVMIIGYLAVLVAEIYVAGQRDECRHADVIIVLGTTQYDGTPSPVLRGRLEHAVWLYQHGYAPYLLFTGGRQPGDRYTEAGTGRRFARHDGVPESAILLETEGHTTLQSLRACKTVMLQRHLHSAILVSDPFHVFRVRRMAGDMGMAAVTSPTPNSRVRSLAKQAFFVRREVGAYLIYRILGI